MGMATPRMMIRLMKLRPKVMPMRSLILSHTGRRSGEKERPKSRRDSRDSQSQYCTMRGLSRPYNSRRRFWASREALGLRVVCMSVGVPGARWITIKETRVIPRSKGIIRPKRFRI